MTRAPETGPAGAGLCWFAARSLPPLLDAFDKEIEGVRAAEDIEYIHRMRVASRRLRAALPLFEECFAPRQYARWMREITAITRALGDARDADVQIAFLARFRKKRAAARGGDGAPDPLEPAIAYLLHELEGRRKQLQARVLSALDALGKSGVVGEMQVAFALRAAACRRTPVQALAYGIPTMAAFRIASRLAALLSYEPWVTQADAVAEHHAMRIAAKKLRYTMEVYGPVYRRNLLKPHARVKRLQEILGDLHDCDVWIDHVARLLLRERGRTRSEAGLDRPGTATLAALRRFLQNREQARVFLHRRYQRYWQALARQKTWDALRDTLTAGRKRRFIPSRERGAEEVRAACEAAAAARPSGLSHARTVTRLALMLFDSLRPLHGMSERDRLVLECAAMLHDAGGTGKAGRRRGRSSLRIFSDESLPLDIAERSAAGLVARTRREKVTIESDPLFPLQEPPAQERILRLAAILRIADGLDHLRTGSVQEIHTVIGSHEVTCDVVSVSDAAQEKEKAGSRSGLFLRVFGRELVIR